MKVLDMRLVDKDKCEDVVVQLIGLYGSQVPTRSDAEEAIARRIGGEDNRAYTFRIFETYHKVVQG